VSSNCHVVWCDANCSTERSVGFWRSLLV
jgi:hypothetical protein